MEAAKGPQPRTGKGDPNVYAGGQRGSGRGIRMGLSDLPESKPSQTNRILLPQIKMKDKMLRHFRELKLFKRQTLDSYIVELLNCINLQANVT